MKDNAISIKNLKFSYNRVDDVLKDISLDIPKGQWITILGHNGSGKSTLSKLIIGLLTKYRGEIYIDGLILSDQNVYDIRKKVGIVFQNPDNQFVGTTVKDDIAFGLENREVDREEMIKRIDIYSKYVNMNHFLAKEPSLLSGGEKQRVAIAGILAMNPDIIIFDEATSMLDPKGTSEIMDLIKKVKDLGDKTIITITHNLKEAVLSDRVIVLNDGQITLDGKPEEVFKEEEKLLEAGLDILTPMKLLKKIKANELLFSQKDMEETLWELILKM